MTAFHGAVMLVRRDVCFRGLDPWGSESYVLDKPHVANPLLPRLICLVASAHRGLLTLGSRHWRVYSLNRLTAMAPLSR